MSSINIKDAYSVLFQWKVNLIFGLFDVWNDNFVYIPVQWIRCRPVRICVRDNPVIVKISLVDQLRWNKQAGLRDAKENGH